MNKFNVDDIIILKFRDHNPVPRKIVEIIGDKYKLEIQNGHKPRYELEISAVENTYELFPLYHTPLYQALRED